MNTIFPVALLSKITTFLSAMFLVSASAHAAIDIDQQPLLVTKPVPGNMAIIGSFEFPTMVTRAYNTTSYSEENDYIGYFNNNRCYEYNYHVEEPKRHFSPTSTQGKDCSNNDKYWSGNFLNWISMQSIDIFRNVLTGGHRSVDTQTETYLEKGIQTGQGSSNSNFKDGQLSNTTIIKKSVPIQTQINDKDLIWSSFYSRIGQESSPMKSTLKFSRQNNLSTTSPTPYNPTIHNLVNSRNWWWPYSINNDNTVYEISIRVKVCEEGKLESNCEPYSKKGGSVIYKPTGLIQQYADQLRFSAFGYLNDNSTKNTYGTNRNRKGGIMHARMKYVGPNALTNQNIMIPNLKKEWDEETGIFIASPDPDDAKDTKDSSNKPMPYSGVVNYINRSGHIIDGTEFKRFDNVSELYYTAYRYLKGLPNIASYTENLGSGVSRDRLIGGLPVITKWQTEDPIQFSCQKNFILGIGDTNTHNDRGIVTDGSDDPVFASDFTKLRNVIHAREEMGDNSVTGSVLGSDYIAVLAYDANANDLRPDLPGKQRASTYWIDILEGSLKSRKNNPYWLAAKYGGFKVPEKFDPITIPKGSTVDLFTDDLWWTTKETLSTGDKRPDNFYVVNKAEDLVSNLTKAFANIQLEQRGSRASLALNSTKLTEGSRAFQSQYASGTWSGNLFAYDIDATTGALSTAPKWNAESQLPAWNQRNVYINKSDKKLDKFIEKGKDLKGFNQDRVEYLLGNRAKETDGTFRTRQGVLGDIVNSQPVFVGNPKVDLFNGKSFTGADKYREWAQSIKRTPMVYVGANDGMLHGFNADTGVEVFAFIPKTVIENGLSEIADKNYVHRYFLDGEITVADAYIDNQWKTILVGTLGAGGVDKDRTKTSNAVFALDITNPEDIKFMWEEDSSDTKHLGINIGKPVIIQDQSKNNPWKVVLGNGPNNNKNKEEAYLISIELEKNKYEKIKIKIEDNGLSAVRAWSSKGDGITDILYAGDMLGNVWKIDSENSKNNPIKLFTATDSKGKAQPITTAPLVGISPHDGSTWIFFGTGQYLNTADLTNKDVQSWYGIKDTNTAITRGQLVKREILGEVQVNDSTIARIIDEGNRGQMLDKAGWYIDLVVKDKPANGERMVTPNQFQGGALIGNTRIPDASDPCAPSGTGRLMAIDPFTGGSLSNSFFDINGNGKVMFNGTLHVISGIGFATGISNPAFLSGKMYISTDNASLSDAKTSGGNGGDDGGIKTPKRTSWRELINQGN